jgi:hypothetical protein
MKAYLMGLLRARTILNSSNDSSLSAFRDMALKNEPMTLDTFVLMSDVRNLAKKKGLMKYGKNTARTSLMLECGF